jgi:hypothetical protein
MNVRDLDSDQVGFGFFWSDPDPLSSYYSSQCDLSSSQSNWNPSYSKSARYEIPAFTAMYTLLNGP